jgi:hypothetical protein
MQHRMEMIAHAADADSIHVSTSAIIKRLDQLKGSDCRR